jgi:hypothetical protein
LTAEQVLSKSPVSILPATRYEMTVDWNNVRLTALTTAAG